MLRPCPNELIRSVSWAEPFITGKYRQPIPKVCPQMWRSFAFISFVRNTYQAHRQLWTRTTGWGSVPMPHYEHWVLFAICKRKWGKLELYFYSSFCHRPMCIYLFIFLFIVNLFEIFRACVIMPDIDMTFVWVSPVIFSFKEFLDHNW